MHLGQELMQSSTSLLSTLKCMLQESLIVDKHREPRSPEDAVFDSWEKFISKLSASNSCEGVVKEMDEQDSGVPGYARLTTPLPMRAH